MGSRQPTSTPAKAISPGQARRLASQAKIIPVVLGGKSEVLDVGRGKRFFTKAQRVAMMIRDRGCTTEGCDWPPGMCHGHHDLLWSRGGPTDLKHGRLLCPKHHATAHHPAYEMTKLPAGRSPSTGGRKPACVSTLAPLDLNHRTHLLSTATTARPRPAPLASPAGDFETIASRNLLRPRRR